MLAHRADRRLVMQHKPHYLSILPFAHPDNVEQRVSQSQRRLWWLLVGIALLSVFLIGMAMWWAM